MRMHPSGSGFSYDSHAALDRERIGLNWECINMKYTFTFDH